MKKLIMTKGLPGSGKTTWAKKVQATSAGQLKRINKDDLRAMLDNSHWSSSNEKFVLKVRDALIQMALCNGSSVIVDDTNLAPKHEERLKQLAHENHALFEVKDYTDVSVEDCITNDLKRERSVGKDVIVGMWKKFLRKPVEPIKQDPNLPHAVILDLDGTLALMHNRGPFEWAKVGQDKICEEVKRVYNFYNNSNYAVIILSGREDVCRNETAQWLENNGVQYDILLMRKAGDNRKDAIIKSEIYHNEIAGKFYIEAIYDDRNQVVEMWRSLGLKCFQVADGDF